MICGDIHLRWYRPAKPSSLDCLPRPECYRVELGSVKEPSGATLWTVKNYTWSDDGDICRAWPQLDALAIDDGFRLQPGGELLYLEVLPHGASQPRPTQRATIEQAFTQLPNAK